MKNKNLLQRHAYLFGGYVWITAEVNEKYAVLQSCGVTSGSWPGFEMPQFGNGDWYDKDIDGLDIHAYDAATSALYERIKDVEYTSAKYGKGLFLVSKKKVKLILPRYLFPPKGSGNYWLALMATAQHGNRFGASYDCAWLGNAGGSNSAWYVNSGGKCSGNWQYDSFVIAPAFNVDLSKIEARGDEIVIL